MKMMIQMREKAARKYMMVKKWPIVRFLPMSSEAETIEFSSVRIKEVQ
jgi:hypothetical protein